jgi:hypothetical protein
VLWAYSFACLFASIIVTLLQCRPISSNWGVPHTCTPPASASLSLNIVLTALDLFLIILPQPSNEDSVPLTSIKAGAEVSPASAERQSKADGILRTTDFTASTEYRGVNDEVQHHTWGLFLSRGLVSLHNLIHTMRSFSSPRLSVNFCDQQFCARFLNGLGSHCNVRKCSHAFSGEGCPQPGHGDGAPDTPSPLRLKHGGEVQHIHAVGPPSPSTCPWSLHQQSLGRDGQPWLRDGGCDQLFSFY